MVQIALGLVQNQVKTTIISLEMTADQVLERMMALDMEIDLFSIQSLPSRSIPQRVFEGISAFAKKVAEYKKYLHIIDDHGYTTDEMNNLFENIYEDKPQVVLIDHLQHIRCDNRRTLEAIDDYLLTLKEFAKKNNICFVILSQVNRQGNEKPTLSHLKSSGKIEEISDTIVLIHRNQLIVDSNNCELIIAKQRYGPVGEHPVYFCGAYTKFFDSHEDYLKRRVQNIKKISLVKDFSTFVDRANKEPKELEPTDPLDAVAEQYRGQ